MIELLNNGGDGIHAREVFENAIVVSKDNVEGSNVGKILEKRRNHWKNFGRKGRFVVDNITTMNNEIWLFLFDAIVNDLEDLLVFFVVSNKFDVRVCQMDYFC